MCWRMMFDIWCWCKIAVLNMDVPKTPNQIMKLRHHVFFPNAQIRNMCFPTTSISWIQQFWIPSSRLIRDTLFGSGKHVVILLRNNLGNWHSGEWRFGIDVVWETCIRDRVESQNYLTKLDHGEGALEKSIYGVVIWIFQFFSTY